MMNEGKTLEFQIEKATHNNEFQLNSVKISRSVTYFFPKKFKPIQVHCNYVSKKAYELIESKKPKKCLSFKLYFDGQLIKEYVKNEKFVFKGVLLSDKSHKDCLKWLKTAQFDSKKNPLPGSGSHYLFCNNLRTTHGSWTPIQSQTTFSKRKNFSILLILNTKKSSTII